MKHSHEKLHLSLASVPSTHCHPCSLPEFSPRMSWWFNMPLQVSSVMLCWVVLTLACPEIVPFALPCCLSYICFGARSAWSNRLCIEVSVVSCFRLPVPFANLVFYNDWYMDINLIHAFHDKTVFLKRCNASKAHWSHACCLHLQSSQSVNVSVWNTEKRDTKQNH